MEILKWMRIKVVAPEKIKLNEPIEIKFNIDTTGLSEDRLVKLGYSHSQLPLNISMRIFSDLDIKLARKINWRIFEKGKKFHRKEELAITETRLNIPLGSALTFPVKLSIPKAFPWVYIKFPKKNRRLPNDIEEFEIKNGISIGAEIDGFDLSEYFNNIIEFSPSDLYDEDRALSILNDIVSNCFSDVSLDLENNRLCSYLTLQDGTKLEIRTNARYVAVMDNLLNALKLRTINLFTHIFYLEVTEFPSNLPRIYNLEGEYVYRIEIIPKQEAPRLKSEITLSKLSLILILDVSIREARRKLRRQKADLFVLLSPDQNNVSVNWELNMYKSKFYRFIKILDGKYLFTGLPQPFMYDDIDFTTIGYYVLKFGEKGSAKSAIELPFVVTNT